MSDENRNASVPKLRSRNEAPKETWDWAENSNSGPGATTLGTTTLSLPTPTGVAARSPALAAVRTADLNDKNIVLIDNGQAAAGFDEYGDVLQWLSEDLRRLKAPPRVTQMHADLVGSSAEDLSRLELEIGAVEPSGVVIGLCHEGVTAPSALLGGLLERAGIPCALLCTPRGGPLAGLMASYDVPQLPLIAVTPLVSQSEQEMSDSRTLLFAAVTSALTKNPPATGISDPAINASSIEIEIEKQDAGALGNAAGVSDALWDKLLSMQLSDGLPVAIPTPRKLAEMLNASGLEADEVLLSGPSPSQSLVTAGAVAVNAVFAGCRPEYFPIIVAAVRAMGEEEFRFFQSAISSYPGGIAVVVSGPASDAVGLRSGSGCLGPGFRANATIGRTINLVLINIARSIPGISNLATFGSACQYTYCFGEAAEGNPWSLWHQDVFDDATSSVTVLKCESPHNVFNSLGDAPKALLRAAASVLSTLGTTATRWPSEQLVLVNPRQANLFANEGMTKRDAQLFLFENARITAPELRSEHRQSDGIPVVDDPSQFRIFVTGGSGSQMMVAPGWGLSRSVTKQVVYSDGN